MSSQKLPRAVSLRKSVNSRATYEGVVPFVSLCRLEKLAAHGGLTQPIVASVSFAEGEDYKPTLDISVRGAVALECQRCMNAVSQPIQVAALLTVVRHDEEAKNRLGDIEPLVISDDNLDLYALIEDEILLSLPIVPMHPEQSCQAVTEFAPSQPELARHNDNGGSLSDESKPSPFSVLAQLKQAE